MVSSQIAVAAAGELASCGGFVAHRDRRSRGSPRAGFAIISSDLRQCLAEAEDPQEKMAEMEKLFLSLA